MSCHLDDHYIFCRTNIIFIGFCRTTIIFIGFCRTNIIFIGRKTCYKGWELEYNGYLMAGYHAQKAGTMYSCVDSDPDTVHGGHTNKNGYLFYLVEARCGTLKCPPYVEGRELVCVVCSKK